MTDMQRGRLNAQKNAITSPTFAQEWLLDATDNWGNFKQDDDGDGTWNLDQDRTANQVNEIADISETTGPSWATPVYSPAGNMTTVPQPVDPTASYAAAFDAWNCLVKLTSGVNTVQENKYDGLRRRTVRKDYVGGSLDETRHFYYSDSWQVLEERLNSSTAPDCQFVWGLRYIDDCVLRDRDANADGSLDERLYALQDANWNVTALVDTAGDVQERDAYQSYGQPLFLDPVFSPQSVSSFDWETLFAGYRWNKNTSLHLVRHRTLHSALGSWMQRDPALYQTGDMSLYVYGTSNPLTTVDPTGLAANICTHLLGPWAGRWGNHTALGATKTVSLAAAVGRPGIVLPTEELVTEIACIASRTLTAVYVCNPCCWATPPASNRVTITRTQPSHPVTTAVGAADDIWVRGVSISGPTPGWWPPFLPGPSVTVFSGFIEGSQGRANRKCSGIDARFFTPLYSTRDLFPNSFECKAGSATLTPIYPEPTPTPAP